MNLVFAAFFGGPLAGGFLLSRNFGRLGRSDRALWCLAAFVLLAV